MNSVVLWLPQGVASYPTETRADARVSGLGLNEVMPAAFILRPAGSSDYLFMHFHDAVQVSVDGQLRDVPADTFFIWAPGAVHHFGHAGKSWRHSWIHCAGDALATGIADSGLPLGQPVTLPDASLADRYLRSIHAEIQAHAEPDTVILTRFFEICMSELRRVVNQGHEEARVPERILAVARYIEGNLAQPMTLAALAGRANLSVSQFSVEFKRHFGTSPMDYVLSQRLQQATYFLRDHNLSISEVARRVGFKTLSTFHASLKSIMA